MFILLNGAFGIGKTIAARALLGRVPTSRLHDPEPVGVALQRASAILRPGGRIDDFQDLALWRLITAWGASWRHRRCAVVIVPMAFSNLTYLDTLAGTLAGFGIVHKLCLVAPLDVVRERLGRRAEAEETPLDQWTLKRAEACCEAHLSPAFGHPIAQRRRPARSCEASASWQTSGDVA